MQKLTEMDASFLQQETVRTPMHISPVLVYDQSGRKDHPVRFKVHDVEAPPALERDAEIESSGVEVLGPETPRPGSPTPRTEADAPLDANADLAERRSRLQSLRDEDGGIELNFGNYRG